MIVNASINFYFDDTRKIDAYYKRFFSCQTQLEEEKKNNNLFEKYFVKPQIM